MLIILLVISIALIILGCLIEEHTRFDGDGAIITGILCTVIFAVAILIVSIATSMGFIIDDKISLYETENNKIDNQIYSIVENYKDYEKSTFKSVKDKNANTLVTLYPELKANSLVKEQIKIYNSNRKQIIKLKQEKLEQKPLRWWLYFGG